MSNYSWPANVVPLTSKNYSLSLGSNITQVAAGGLPRSGVNLTIEAVPFSLNFSLSDYQYQILNQFYYSRINKGANSFFMDLDAGNGIETVLVVIKAGTWSMVKPSNGNWHLAFTAIAESTSSQTEEFCSNLLDLNDCYGNDLPKVLSGFSDILNALPDA